MLKEIKPEYVAAAFDLAGPTFRHEAYEDYKAHRAKAPQELYDQIPLVKDLLKAFGIPVLEKEGYEADDLIGSLSEKFKNEKNTQIIIVSGDLDTLQLVDGKKVVVYTPKKGLSDTVIYDQSAVIRRFGLKPEQLADFRGLKGDPSDNIPGVPGIGEKTASHLLQEYGTLENLFAAVKKLSKSKKTTKADKKLKVGVTQKLLDNEDQAFFSKQLSQIVKDLEISISLKDARWAGGFQADKTGDIFKTYGFHSLLERLHVLYPSQAQQTEVPTINFNTSKSKTTKFGNQTDIKKLSEKLKPHQVIGIYHRQPMGGLDQESYLSLALDENTFYQLSLTSIQSNSEILSKVFYGNTFKVAHNFKSLLKFLSKAGLDLDLGHYDIGNNIFDTAIAGWILNSDLKEPVFDSLYFQEFGENPPSETKKAAAVLKLYQTQQQKLKEAKLIDVFQKIEMPLVSVLFEMEKNGVKINTESVEKLKTQVTKSIQTLEKEIYKFAGIEFNINSSQQLSDVLFVRLGLKGRIKKTPGGVLSTAASELEKLRELHPIITLIIEYREVQKLKTTYIDPFPELVKSDGRIHTTYLQASTTTGRLASQDPNLQNIPVRSALGQQFRQAFIAEKGCKLLSLDYSQVELRIAAYLSKDQKMIDAFNRGEDIHTRTAVEIFGVRPEDVSSDMRREAKILNFGILYGMGIRAFAIAASIKQDKAKAFMERYFTEFKGLSDYLNQVKQEAHEKGYVSTLFGRRRQLPELYASMVEVSRQAERMAVNMPIQGTAADIMKLAMSQVYKFIHQKYSSNQVKILLQVHDELLLEVKDTLVLEVASQLKKIMERIYKLDVPLIVDAKAGLNWSDLRSLSMSEGYNL